MKRKQILATICAAALVAVMGTTAYAANNSSAASPSAPPAAADSKGHGRMMGKGSFDPANLTADQKAAIDAKKAQMQADMAAEKAKADATTAAWNALTDAQKEEVYALNDQAIDARIAILDKYVSLGLMTADDAAAMKDKLNASKDAARQSGKMPEMGGMAMKGDFGGRGMGGGMMNCKPGMGGGMMNCKPGSSAAPAASSSSM